MSRIPRGQQQSSGNDSVNVLAGRDVILKTGFTLEEIRTTALDLFRENFLSLGGVAKETANSRAAQLTEDLLNRLLEHNPRALASFGDPDMLRVLYNAQEGFACSGEEDLEKTLLDLLADRAGQTDRDLKTLVLNEAITALPKLTRRHRAALAVCFFLKHAHYTGSLDLDAYYGYMSEHLSPFADEVPDKRSDYMYMQSAGVGSLGGVADLESTLYRSAVGFFTKGFTKDEVPKDIRSHLSDPTVFIPAQRNPAKLQFNAISQSDLEALAVRASSLGGPVSRSRMDDTEIKADLISHIPVLERIFGIWGRSGLGGFELTAGGLAIGHACQRQEVHDPAPLEDFLT